MFYKENTAIFEASLFIREVGGSQTRRGWRRRCGCAECEVEQDRKIEEVQQERSHVNIVTAMLQSPGCNWFWRRHSSAISIKNMLSFEKLDKTQRLPQSSIFFEHRTATC
jgi:hypothetical protein